MTTETSSALAGQAEEGSTDSSVWVFGYGSLLWKINFPYQLKIIGYIKGYARRFWQASVEHRGTPEQPGRVVTLVEDAESDTWGMAYKVDPKDIPEVMAYLNKREFCYTTQELTFHPQDNSLPSFTVLAYIATQHNPHYLGPQTIDSLAECVVVCSGKSGPNTEYVLELAKSMQEIAPHVEDDHLYSLNDKVKELMKHRDAAKIADPDHNSN